MSTSVDQTEGSSDDGDQLYENELEESVESIQEELFFDASSMANLTPSALVSVSYVVSAVHS
jgi:hypothetical protein